MEQRIKIAEKKVKATQDYLEQLQEQATIIDAQFEALENQQEDSPLAFLLLISLLIFLCLSLPLVIWLIY